ncbi:MAG TPA: glycosyl hydrolase [Gemmatimonadaceae bacterium]|nr:glycosyl hydrolase [Gemmatimonadaceae bacterium]HPV74899.1 glycosyl hydrolase [Gemmatimonadaceae bacterium]
MSSSVRRPGSRWRDASFAVALAAVSSAAGITTLEAQARPAGVRAMVAPAPTAPMTVDTSLFNALRWREIGPARGGRSVAVAGSAQRPLEYWMGTTGGGVYKTTDAGMSWQPATDRYFGGTIGAIAVDHLNPDIVWVGGGETDIRGNTSHGDGLWKTTDGGRTWQMLGFKEEYISTIRIHPTNPSIAYIGVFGDVFKATSNRGVYKTTDGGKTFSKVLFVNDSSGVIDIAMDVTNPEILYVAMWQAWRAPWGMSSGGLHSGLYKTTDGGATWSNLVKTAKGLPQGNIGKIGLTVSPVNPQLVWALIEHDSGGVYKSNDGGANWRYINRERKLRQRAWYYSQIYADPKDTNIVYGLNVGFFRSNDGGKTFPASINPPHGDNHDLWIAPNDNQRMVQGNDGGANVSFTAGRAWTAQTFPTAQFYHVTTTNDWPYNICGAQQDNSTLCGPSRKQGSIDISDWYDAGGCESGYIAANPAKPNITYAGCYGGNLDRRDRETGFTRDVTVYPRNPMGHSSEDIKVRFQWTFPIVFSRHNANVLYAAGSQLFRSTNEGESWTAVSPELARKDPKTMGPSGGPITKDQTGVETYGLIFAFDESPVTPGLLWAGTDDGYIWISRNNGVKWDNVTPSDIGDFTRISIIEPSRYAAGTAYVAANRYALGDKTPILYKTTDYGKTWTKIVNGIKGDHFARTIREDPVRRGLLFAGTERGVYVSFDDGQNWQWLQKNLPFVPVHDLTIKDNDVIAATHGRSFWVMDDISALRQYTPAIAEKGAHLFKPVDAYRTQWSGGFGGGGRGGSTVGGNPQSGAVVYYTLKSPNQKVTIDFMDAKGTVIQSFTSDMDPDAAADSVRQEQARAARIDSLVRGGASRDSAMRLVRAAAGGPGGGGGGGGGFGGGARRPRVPNRAGLNTFAWNLRYPDAVSFDNLIMWAANTTGPVAPPGTYAVKLTVNGESQTQRIVVKKDPRGTATDADLLAQFNLLIAIRDKTTEANNAVRMARNMRWNVNDRTGKLTGAPAEEFKAIAGTMMKEVTSAEQEVYQTKNESNQDPLNFPIKLNNEVAGVASYVGQGEYRPTKQAYQVFEELKVEVDKQIKALKSSMDANLPKLNAILRAAGLQELKPSTEEIKPQRPNVVS